MTTPTTNASSHPRRLGRTRLAPYRPIWHAMVLGVVGFVVSLAGAAATWNHEPPLGPHWYALAIAAISIPCAWVGGKLRERQLRTI